MNRWERKEKIGHGGISEVAKETGFSPGTVSLVVSDKIELLSEETVQKVRMAVARRIGEPVEVVFPETAAA